MITWVHTVVGNHTLYYKNTNDVNAIDLLLREYDNIRRYSETVEYRGRWSEYSSCTLD